MVMATSFFSHKGGVNQSGILPAPNPDPVIAFQTVKWNEGGYYDPQTSRLHGPGMWYVEASYNVANPVDGGKYYALLRKNSEPNIQGNPNAFEMLRPNRMSGAADTLGTAVGGLVNLPTADDYVEAVFQHSNVAPGTQATIDGTPFASYFCGYRIGDAAVENQPPPPPPSGTTEQTQGTPVGPIQANTWAYVDRSWSLNPVASVTALGLYTLTPGTFPIKIARRNSAGNYDVVQSIDITHGGTGWEDVVLPTAYAVPNDGKEYFVAAFTTGVNHMMFDLKPRACANWNITGNNVSMAEVDPTPQYYILGVRATYG